MQRIFKVTSILLFISILSVSCGGVTPVPTITPTLTNTPRPSATLPASQTPTSSPTAYPTSTPTSSLPAFQPSTSPVMDVSQYKLYPWLEQDYGYILNNIEEYQDAFGIPYFKLDDYSAVFQSERLLRFPNASERNQRLWELLLTKPEVKNAPGIHPGEDLMSMLISSLLEQGVPITDLTAEIEKHGTFLVDELEVSNLLGTHEEGLVIQIVMDGAVDRVMAVYAVTLNQGKYQVDAITPWMSTNHPGFGIYYELYGIGDTNNNGLSEFVIQEQTGASGMPQVWSETVLHAEWSNDKKRFAVREIPVFYQSCDEFGGGPCEGDWEFSSLNSKNILLTHSYWSTRGNCPDLIIERNSIWDGKQYPTGELDILPPQDDLSLQCRLAWAETAFSLGERIYGAPVLGPGWKNEQVISIVEQSVEEWIPQMTDIWGPAGMDYFKLRLAIWYDLRGEDERASEILEDLVSNPNPAEYDFIFRMASTYLQARSRRGKTQACRDLQNAYSEASSEIAADWSMYNNDKLFLEQWGVVDWKSSLCDADEMFASEANRLGTTFPKVIKDFIKKSGARIYLDQHVDLNNDNGKDYLALVEFNDSDNVDAWAFIATPGGITSQYIFSFYSEDSQPRPKVRSIQTGEELVHLIALEDELILTRFLADSSPEVILEEYGVQNFNLIEDTSPPQVVINVDNFLDGQENKSFQWNSSTKEFVQLDTIFVSAQTELEKMFYDLQDYSGVIQYIDQFLSTAPPETLDWYECGVNIPDGCNYLPEWYAPYFRYLRGLASEQLGEGEQAKQTYYELWTDFPNNIFGVAASLKLEPVNP